MRGAGETGGLTRYLSPMSVWALSFGCAVGWGAFVMPGTTFLPSAGPLGTALGIAIGAMVMMLIGANYQYLMNRYPDAGGTLTYASRQFGYDHGFLSAWFLILVYFAIIWANATALSLIARKLLGTTFQFGFHYSVFGYDVYLGEALLSIAAIVLLGLVCIHGKRFAAVLQTVLALILLAGIAVCGAAVLRGGVRPLPSFAPSKGTPVRQIVQIVALMPWAFAGFESVSNSTAGFRFSTKKTIWIFAASLLAGTFSYIVLAQMAASVQPQGFADWTEYVAGLDSLEGLKGLPTFFATNAALGKTGIVVLGITVTAAIITGIVGNFIAASRLLYSMAEDGILPKWFAGVNEDHSPKNALIFLVLISLVVPFLGRTAIGWIVDVNTIGATIAYAYTSAAAYAAAKRFGCRGVRVTGVFGVAVSVLFFFYFMSWNASAMATESYLILAGWSILGFVYSRYMLSWDKQNRFGHSPIMWIGAVFLIFFTTLMWVKQSTQDVTAQVLKNLEDHDLEELLEHGVVLGAQERADVENFVARQMSHVDATLTRNSLIQLMLILFAIAIMISIYITMQKREEEQKTGRTLAEENSRAKTVFLSNMSHDIRTPMNAIIGYTDLARRKGTSEEEMRGYLKKIDASSRHLLALINDVLEMSRIESGKMELEPVEVDLCRTLDEVRDMFSTQMAEKKIAFTVDTQVRRRHVLCDENCLNRMLLNLLSNACKFTPEGGSVAVTLAQTGGDDTRGDYELRVRDSGIGMTEEFAGKVFEAFERERTSTVSGIQGTGLGMAITKSIVDLMGGTIGVESAPGKGTEFIIRVGFELLPDDDAASAEEEEAEPGAADFSGLHLLLAEDNEINREIATLILEDAGFTVESVENGREAVERVRASKPGELDLVLMDIQMPEMNGYDAARAIRGLGDPALAGIPIIAMTANAFNEDVKTARDAGMNAHISKPIDIPSMLATLRHVFAGRTKHPE